MEIDLQIGPWLIQPSLNTVSQDGKTIHVEPKVMEVLVCLAKSASETVPKEKLIQTVWSDTFVSDDVLIRAISELRRVFEDDARDSRIIQTIPKRGYRLVAAVRPANGAQAATEPPVSLDLASRTAESVPHRYRYRLAAASAVVVLAAAVTLLALDLGGVRSRFLLKANFPAIHSLAVLPLVNLSNDSNQEYFADGMTDALITDLSQVSSLRVISRTTVMAYKKTGKNLPEIARELNVDGIVEGTVQHSGDRVRITAQLIHGPTDAHLWAQSYERDMRDVLTLQGEVAKSIAEGIRARLTPQEKARLAQSRPVNLKVLEAYLQGEHHLHNYGRGYNAEELRKAAEYFQQAIAEDPGFAPAYVKLCETYDWEDEMLRPSEVMPREKATAEKALSLDPNLSDAHLAVARVKFSYEWDWAAAEKEFRKALELNPSNADAHESLGNYLETMGHLSEGLDEQRRAQELDPQRDHMSNGFYFTRQYDRGIEWLQRQIEINPGEGVLYAQLVDFYAEKGMEQEYIETAARFLTLYGFPQLASFVRSRYAAVGYRQSLRELAQQLELLQKRDSVFVPIWLASLYVRAGDKEKAFYWLEEAYQARDGSMPYLNCYPGWDTLRSDPRFKDLVRRVGLAE